MNYKQDITEIKIRFLKMIRLAFVFLLIVSIITNQSFAQETKTTYELFEEAKDHFSKGEYRQAIEIYNTILETSPNNSSTLKMMGIAESNLGYHQSSLKHFFKVLQQKADDPVALTGLGVGFGNLGEYHEAKKYLEQAQEIRPNNTVIKNYKESIEKVLAKYPYTPTEKPNTLIASEPIPKWVKPSVKWWSEGLLKDSEFLNSMSFLIENKILKIAVVKSSKNSQTIPEWVRNTSSLWASDKTSDSEFISGIQYLMENGILVIENRKASEKTQNEKQLELAAFENYLRKISNNISKEKRYIEYPNPSGDVIKKFSRDYVQWNFEEEAQKAASHFPNPEYEIIDEKYILYYKVYVNEQPSGLPLNHVGTLHKSFEFWEKQELVINEKKAQVEFEITEKKDEANVWVTWVVRELPNQRIGHAHLGKGVVEVTLGDFRCDGSFQLYDVETVKKIMDHELGHSIGLAHVNDKNNIMYGSIVTDYAYCLLRVS